jgi:VanZ family protein
MQFVEALMKLKYISWLPAVVIMGIIFYFSSRPVDDSNESSLTITNSILSIYENISNTQYQTEKRGNIIITLNHIIRKGAHFTEYAVLACAIALHFWVSKRKKIWLLMAPIIVSALYASSDEFHQTMVQGRGGQVQDVLLDTTGAIAGSLVFSLMISYIVYRRKRRALVKSPQ